MIGQHAVQTRSIFNPFDVAHELLLTFTSEDWMRYAQEYNFPNWPRFRDHVLHAVKEMGSRAR